METKLQIEQALGTLAKLDKFAGVESVSQALQDATSTIDALRKELDFKTEMAYNFSNKYYWLRARVAPRHLADAMGMPWTDLANSSPAAKVARIEQYVESGLAFEIAKTCEVKQYFKEH